jgi:hypothetical protein
MLFGVLMSVATPTPVTVVNVLCTCLMSRGADKPVVLNVRDTSRLIVATAVAVAKKYCVPREMM